MEEGGAEREEKRREEGEVEESGGRRVGFSRGESGYLGTPDIPARHAGALLVSLPSFLSFCLLGSLLAPLLCFFLSPLFPLTLEGNHAPL